MKCLLAILVSALLVLDSTQAQDLVFLSGPEISQNKTTIQVTLQNNGRDQIHLYWPNSIILQHKNSGDWINTPTPGLSKCTEEGLHTKLEPNSNTTIGLALRDYAPLVHKEYRFKIVTLDPMGKEVVSTYYSAPAAADQLRRK